MEPVNRLLKNKPLMIGIAVIGAIVIFFLFFSNGSSAGSAVAAQSQADAQQAAINAQLQAKQMEIQGQIALANIQAGIEASNANATLAALQLQTEAQVHVADLQSADALAALTKQLEAQKYQTDVQAQLASQQLSTQQQIIESQLEASIARDTIAADVAKYNAQVQATLSTNALNAQANIVQAQLAAMTSQYLAETDKEKAIELARIDSDTALGLDAGRTARVQSGNQMTSSIFGGLFGAIGSIFSDVRVKENIQFEGFRQNGLPYYSYNYKGSSEKQYGVMAQEAIHYNPSAVHYRGGYLEVDYSRL